ncbi:MAG TPA: PepSY domain-containing protein [Gammaproteobacteria bacterium]
MTRHKRHRPQLRSLYQWHRYLGLAVALLAVVLALTGVMLNHTEQLDLDKRQLSQRGLLAWYGIEPPSGRFFRAGEQWLSQWGEQLYLGRNELSYRHPHPLVGAVRLPAMIVAASDNELLLLTPEGQLIERLDGLGGIPSGIKEIALSATGQVRLKTSGGGVIGHPDSDSWQPEGPSAGQWPATATPPPWLRRALAQQHPGPSLSLERVVLDLHSGRLFGSWGHYLMDGAALLLLLNAASGVWIWWRRHRQQQRRRRQGL